MKFAIVYWTQLLPLIYSVYAAPTNEHLHYDGPMCQIGCEGSAPCTPWGARFKRLRLTKVLIGVKQTGILAHVTISVWIWKSRKRWNVSGNASEAIIGMVAKVSKAAMVTCEMWADLFSGRGSTGRLFRSSTPRALKRGSHLF